MFIGHIQFLDPAKIFAKVRPSLEQVKHEWWVIKEVERQFPANGLVYWARPKDAALNALVMFDTNENSGGDGAAHREKFKVTTAEYLMEVLDLKRRGGREAVRVALTTSGLPITPPSGKVLLLIDETHIVGPLRLTQAPGGLIVDPNERHRIPWFDAAKVQMARVPWASGFRLVLSTPLAAQPDGYFDWDEDRLVVRRALEVAAKTTEMGKKLNATKAVLTELADSVTSLGSGPEMQLQQYRVCRALAAIPKADLIAASEELTALVSALPFTKAAVDEVVARAKETAQAEARSQLASEQAAFAQARQERQRLEQDLAELKGKVKTATRDREAAIASAERLLDERMKAAIERPAELLAQAALLKPFIRGGGAASPVDAPPAAPRLPRWNVEAAIPDVQTLRKEIVGAYGARGLSGVLGLRLHGAFAAGLLPAVSGPAAMDALVAYASVVTKARLTIVEVRPEVAEVRDLFGAFQPARGRFLPHASGLLDLVLGATGSTGTALVVLEGANRGATESFLPQLAALVRDQSRALTLFHEVGASADEPYKEHATIRWPKNVLVAATLTEGPATLPVTPLAWASAVHLRAGVEQSLGAVPGGARAPTEVPDDSSLFESTNPKYDEIVREILHAIESGFPKSVMNHVRSITAGPLQRFGRGLAVVVADEAVARTTLLQGCVLPVIASLRSEDERAQCVKVCEELANGSFELEPVLGDTQRALG